MDYQEFKECLKTYDTLYRQGLKKQANLCIASLVKEIQMLNDLSKDTILYQFTQGLCDAGMFEFLRNRGNGDVPFALKTCLGEWLYARCLKKRMPELRWFYEVFRQDKCVGAEALEFLKEAYRSEKCDEKTVKLLFAAYLETLEWGAHHFPDGCIITLQTKEAAFQKCRSIAEKRKVDCRLQAQLTYFEILYSCYDHCVSDGDKKKFHQYCKEADLEFYESKAYFYSEG